MVKISSEVPKCFKSFGGSCAWVLMPSEVITNLYSEIFLMRRDVDSFIFFVKSDFFLKQRILHLFSWRRISLLLHHSFNFWRSV